MGGHQDPESHCEVITRVARRTHRLALPLSLNPTPSRNPNFNHLKGAGCLLPEFQCRVDDKSGFLASHPCLEPHSCA